MVRVGRFFVGLLVLALVGCGDDDGSTPRADASLGEDAAPPPPPSEECNPLAPEWDCLLPFPSDHFLSGGEVAIPEDASFVLGDAPANMLGLFTPDGFSVAGPVLAVFPQGVDDAELVSAFDDLDRSQTLDSPTLILDAETGELVPHFAELDPVDDDFLDQQALLIRPAAPLDYERRYVVAIHGLAARGGGLLDGPEGFAALRDGATPPDRLSDAAARYDADVFAPLETAGVDRASLQLAWDFTTGSRERVTRDLLLVRDNVIARFESEPPAVTVTEVIDDPAALGDLAEHIARRIEITIEVPDYLTDTTEGVGRLARDDAGQPLAGPRRAFAATILVPKSVDTATEPAPFMQFGHGFFGRRTEIVGSFQPAFADERGYVVGAIDWYGMFAPDQNEVGANIVTDGADEADTLSFIDRVHQGMANQLALAHAAQTTLLELPELQREGGAPIFERGGEIFYGISQGHILGGTYAGISPYVQKTVLGSGGANFSMMMYRSVAFGAFRILLDARTDAPIDRQKFAALLQLTMDRIDPLTYAPGVLASPPEGAPAGRQLLMQHGLADAAVPAIAGHFHARALGLPLMEPAPRDIWGLETMAAPLPSALVEADFGVEPEERPKTFPANEVHEGVRRQPALQEQVHRFLRVDGVVEHTCDGVCDPG